jgi:hypothetical protein
MFMAGMAAAKWRELASTPELYAVRKAVPLPPTRHEFSGLGGGSETNKLLAQLFNGLRSFSFGLQNL